MRRSALLVSVLAAVVVTLPAHAATGTATAPTTTTPTTGKPKPAPKAIGGRMSIALQGGIGTRAVRYYARGQRVVVVGRLSRYAPDQVATLTVLRNRRTVARYRARIRRSGSGGRFVVRFVARRRGALRLVAKHARTPEQRALRAASRKIDVVVWSAGSGAHGVRVLLLQRRLLALGFAVPLSGVYDGGTERAVLAYRKTNNMSRTGFASETVYSRLLRGLGAFRLRYRTPGKHVEFDWSRQVLVLARDGKPFRTYHASSGKPSTPTVFGTYHFYSKTPGTNAHGMVDSNYFVGGYAIHGYAEVPAYAASHGCIRVPIPSAAAIYREIDLGETIYVYP